MAPGIIELRRPQLGDAQLLQRHRSQLAVQILICWRLSSQRSFHGAHRLQHRAKVGSPTGERQADRGQMEVEAGLARLGHRVSSAAREIYLPRDLFKLRFDDERRGRGERQLRVVGGRVARQKLQQLSDRGDPTVED